MTNSELLKFSHRLPSEITDDVEDIDLLSENAFVSQSFNILECVNNLLKHDLIQHSLL